MIAQKTQTFTALVTASGNTRWLKFQAERALESFLLKHTNVGDVVGVTVKNRKPNRTETQNNSLHLWYDLKANQCREAGVTPRMAFEKTMELEMTPEIMKSIWKFVQKAMFNKDSTTQLNKLLEIDELVDHLNRFFATNWFLEEIEFPHDEERAYVEIK